MILTRDSGNNLISAHTEHIDENFDMLCDSCGLELPISNYLTRKSIETVTSGENLVKISGNMPEKTTLEAIEISNAEATLIAQSYLQDIESRRCFMCL